MQQCEALRRVGHTPGRLSLSGSRTLLRGVAGLALAGGLAGCNESADDTPTRTATDPAVSPTPSPTPTEMDTARAFVASSLARLGRLN